jgi:hypothetical protein
MTLHIFKKHKALCIPCLVLTGLTWLMAVPSCANVTAGPSGGPKDTLPPVIVRVSPPNESRNFQGKRVEIKFNEFPKLKDAFNQIFLSPPQSKRPVSVARGKSIIVTFAEPLDSATTYSLHFGQSIVDNNEDNPYGSFVYSFSTGNRLDSMLMTGYVVDAQTLLPIENISIFLHPADVDTAVFKKLPKSVGKSDHWGYYMLYNLPDMPFQLFAVEDQNTNYKLETDSEAYAFLDSLVRPNEVMVPDSAGMKQVSPLDTTAMLARPINHTLYAFKEIPLRQMLREKERPADRHFYLTFLSHHAQVISLQIEGVDSTSLIRERSFRGDTLRFWLRQNAPDTLKVKLRYMRTDSLDQLSPFEEQFKLAKPPVKEESAQEQYANRRNAQNAGQEEARKDLLDVKITSNPEFVEQDGFRFTFPAYPVQVRSDDISLSYTTARKEVINTPFSFERDTHNGCIYYLKAHNWVPTTEYQLMVPASAFTDINGFTNDTLSHNVTLPDQGKAGRIGLTLRGGQGGYIVELLSDTRDRLIRKLYLQADEKGSFPYLKDGAYVIRITEDRNGNGAWDTGNLKDRLQPERVRFFSFDDGKDLIEIKDARELEQMIDLDKIFSNDPARLIPKK